MFPHKQQSLGSSWVRQSQYGLLSRSLKSLQISREVHSEEFEEPEITGNKVGTEIVDTEPLKDPAVGRTDKIERLADIAESVSSNTVTGRSPAKKQALPNSPGSAKRSAEEHLFVFPDNNDLIHEPHQMEFAKKPPVYQSCFGGTEKQLHQKPLHQQQLHQQQPLHQQQLHQQPLHQQPFHSQQLPQRSELPLPYNYDSPIYPEPAGYSDLPSLNSSCIPYSTALAAPPGFFSMDPNRSHYYSQQPPLISSSLAFPTRELEAYLQQQQAQPQIIVENRTEVLCSAKTAAQQIAVDETSPLAEWCLRLLSSQATQYLILCSSLAALLFLRQRMHRSWKAYQLHLRSDVSILLRLSRLVAASGSALAEAVAPPPPQPATSTLLQILCSKLNPLGFSFF